MPSVKKAVVLSKPPHNVLTCCRICVAIAELSSGVIVNARETIGLEKALIELANVQPADIGDPRAALLAQELVNLPAKS